MTKTHDQSEPKIYRAPKPEYSNREWFQYVALRIIFPPVLLWDLLKMGVNKLIGKFIGSQLLPAQNFFPEPLNLDSDLQIRNPLLEGLTAERIQVETHDGVKLDTLEIKNSLQESLALKDQKYIINFIGNGMCYEEEYMSGDMADDANNLQANVIGFNFRGVAGSTGRTRSKNDLVTDGIAQVQRLLDAGVSPQNIVLKSHSLGAGVATLVTLHFHKLGKPVNIFNGRSFSSLTNVGVGHIRLFVSLLQNSLFGQNESQSSNTNKQKERLSGKIVGEIARPIIKLILTLSKWEINASEAFKKIPEKNRQYMVVRTHKAIREYYRDDPVIVHYSSIYKALAPERRAKKEPVKKLINKIESIEKSYTNDSLKQAKENLVDARKEITKGRKMQSPVKVDSLEEDNAHCVGLSELKNRSGDTAQTFFYKFANNVFQSSEPKQPTVEQASYCR